MSCPIWEPDPELSATEIEDLSEQERRVLVLGE